MKSRGVKDILIICADGLSGIKEAITAAYPQTEYQRCIVHQVRNTLKYVADKDMKPFATDLKTIYQASNEEKALSALERVTMKWSEKYPNSIPKGHPLIHVLRTGGLCPTRCEKLEAELGCNLADFQVFGRCQKSHLYHKRDRKPECDVSKTEPAAQCISQRYGSPKSLIFSYIRSYEKMDHANPKLGTCLWRTEYHV